LADVVVDLKVNVCRAGKTITSDEWVQHLKALGGALLERWLVIMAEETPIFLRPIVNRTKFQRYQVTQVRKSITDKIEFLAVELPIPSPSQASGTTLPDLRSKAAKRQEFVIPRREAKGWHHNDDWAEAIKKRHPDKPITARTLYNYLSGATDPTHVTRW